MIEKTNTISTHCLRRSWFNDIELFLKMILEAILLGVSLFLMQVYPVSRLRLGICPFSSVLYVDGEQVVEA